MGEGYVIGEEDQAEPGGVFRQWDFTEEGPEDAGVIFDTDWTRMSRYLSHCNAPQPRVLITLASELWLVRLDAVHQETRIAPTLAHSTDPQQPYERKPKASLDPSGEWACWTADPTGSGQLEAFLVRLPRSV